MNYYGGDYKKVISFLVQIMTYYSWGRWIVETQQMGQKRAKYGSKVIKILSEKLQEEFGKGYLFEVRQKRFIYDEENS